jgi:predicted nucleic acid-binding protein
VVLVDTSIWIRYLSNHFPEADHLDVLLDQEEVVGHELVYGELLVGDLGGRRQFLLSYRQIAQATTLKHSEVVEFVTARRLNGNGVGWIDVHLIASALIDGAKVWSADPRFRAMAGGLGVEYKPN